MSGVARVIGTIASIVAIAVPAAAPIATAVAIAANVTAQVTQKRPRNDRQGLQLNFKIDPDGPIEYPIGRTATGGTVVHRETYGTDNHYQTYFVDLGLGPIHGIETFLADRAPISFSGTSALGYYAKWMWQDRQLGAMPETRALGHGVTSPPFGSIPAQVPGWSAAHKLSGHAAASLTMLFDTKARRYANGEPLPGWVLYGNLVWDPRLDSTYPGGSGPCRRDQPATWVYSETPALHGLKWRRGIYQNGKRIMGVGAPVPLIDLPRIVESANVQEANGWKVGGILNSRMNRWEALKLIEQAGGAEPVANAALMSTLQKMPRVSVGEITGADILARASIPGSRPRRERINGFRARFRSEAHGWEMVPIDLVQIAAYVEADRDQIEDGDGEIVSTGERSGSADYALVQDANQAAQLAAYEIYDSRELGPIELQLKPRFIAYRIGDALTVNSPEHGLVNQLVLVRGRRIDPKTGIVTLRLITETTGKHAEALGRTGNAPPVPTLTYAPLAVPAPAAADWTAVGGTVENAAGHSIPAITITGAVANSAADGVVFDFRKVGDADWINPSIDAPDTVRKVITDVAPETAYEVGVRHKVGGVIGDRRVYGPVVTGQDSTAVLAEGKAEIFFRDLAPTANESRANDLWINGAGRVFRRLAGSGALAIGGKRVLLAGSAVLLPWTLADDQRIGAALVAAGAAQATAERKTETYISETQPADGTYGDLWFKPSTKEIRTFNGSAWVLSSTVGALPEQIEAIEAAAELATEAKTVADGKARILWRPTAPSAAETDEGDRWVNTAAGNVEYRRMPGSGALSIGGARILLGGVPVSLPWTRADDQRIAQALGDAAGAQATADGKIETYFSETVPTADALGDLWFKPSTGELRRWSGSSWDLVSTIGATAAQLETIGNALTAAENAQATADGKIVTFWQAEQPADASEGDLWIDTDAGNRLARYDGSIWVEVQDSAIGDAIEAAAGAKATADGKVTTFVGEAPPVAEALGDLWFRPSTGELRRWDGDIWDLVATIGATSAEREAIEAAAGLAEEAKTVADGKARLFYRTSAPAASEASEGDRWVHTGLGNVEYRRLGGSGQLAVGGKRILLGGNPILLPWTRSDDQRIAASLAAAAGAQATADGKIETFFTEAAPVADGIGDLWYRPSTKELRRWSGSAWDLVSTVGATEAQLTLISNALTASENAQATADGKIAAFYQPSAPAEADEGDLWIDTDDGNKLNRYDGAQWVLTRDTGITAALNAASGAQTTADKKVTTFVGEVEPVAEATGDLWYRPSTKEFRRWDGDSWDVVSTVGATQDQVDAIDAKSRTFRQATMPAAAESKGGDLWINPAAGNRTYQRLAGGGRLTIGANRILLGGNPILLPWTLASDQRIDDAVSQGRATAAALEAARSALAKVATDASEAKAIADGKIDSFYQASAPTGASEGDIWWDTDDSNKQYRFTGGAWLLARDGGIGAAIDAASTAQDTADGKVTTFIQEGAPTPEGVGDLWFKPSLGVLYRWSGGTWDTTTDVTAKNQHSLTAPITRLITGNSTGVVDPGQLPLTVSFRYLVGDQDISHLVNYAIIASANDMPVEINNTPGDTHRGDLTILSLTAFGASAGISASYGGRTLSSYVTVRQIPSPPASGGGGGGGGQPGNPASTSSFTAPGTSTSHSEVGRLAAVKVGAAGTVKLVAQLYYSSETQGSASELDDPPIETYFAAKWQHSTDGSNWTDVAVEHVGSGATSYYSTTPPRGQYDSAGSVRADDTKSGLTDGASIIFRLVGRMVTGTAIGSLSGTATATPQ